MLSLPVDIFDATGAHLFIFDVTGAPPGLSLVPAPLTTIHFTRGRRARPAAVLIVSALSRSHRPAMPPALVVGAHATATERERETRERE